MKLDCDYYGDHPELEEWHQNAHDYMGGDFENACSTADGIAKFEAAKAAGPVVVAGCQQIPPIDCGGKCESIGFLGVVVITMFNL